MAVYYINVVNEADEKSIKKMFKGKEIDIDGDFEKLDLAIKLCNKHWEEILDEAAEDWFDRIKYCDDKYGSVRKKYPDKATVRKHISLDNVYYHAEGFSRNPVCGTMEFIFDVNPAIDPQHFYTLYIDFDKHYEINFDNSFDG